MACAEPAPVVKSRRPHPVETLRSLAAALGSAATHEAASAAVRGAADGLREQLPEAMDGPLQALLQDALVVVGRLLHQAALREQAAPGTLAHDTAAATMRGALEELEAQWQEGGMPLHGLLQRLHQVLDQVAAFAASREREIRTPGERARSMASGAVDGAMDRLHEGMPLVSTDAQALAFAVGQGVVQGLEARAPQASEALALALERAGQGLVHGLARGLALELRALAPQLRRPAAWLTGGGAALLTLGLLAARGRRA